jgi:hypothetical protein
VAPTYDGAQMREAIALENHRLLALSLKYYALVMDRADQKTSERRMSMLGGNAPAQYSGSSLARRRGRTDEHGTPSSRARPPGRQGVVACGGGAALGAALSGLSPSPKRGVLSKDGTLQKRQTGHIQDITRLTY